jgi:hypothetical protein
MRCAAAYKPDSEPLDQFIRRKGGINACAARFTRWRGRGAALRAAGRRKLITRQHGLWNRTGPEQIGKIGR